MKRLQVSLLAAGILILAFVLTAVGPKRVMAALGYTPVREVNAPGRQPVAFELLTSRGDRFTVPAGKRLVITTVSASTNGGGELVRGSHIRRWVLHASRYSACCGRNHQGW